MNYSALLLAMISSAHGLPTVAVTGSTGRLGRLGVKALVAKGYKVKALLRHEVSPTVAPSGDKSAEPAAVAAWLASMPGVELVKGDVTDRASLDALLTGCTACLALHGARRTRKLSDLWRDPSAEPTHSKQVNYAGVANLIDAAKASGTCKRIVRITGKGESPWSVPSILINAVGSMAKAWNYEGEQLLREAAAAAGGGGGGIEYTIVRPGIMGPMDELPPAALALADDGGDLKVAPIPHAAIAELCVESLDAPNAGGATLTAMTVPSGEGSDTWAPLLATVAPDRRPFASSLLREHRRAVAFGTVAGAAVLGLGFLGAGYLLKAILTKLLASLQLAATVTTPRLVVGLAVGLLIARMV